MAKARAYGADSTLKACRETSYSVAPLSGYRGLDFKSCDLSAEQPLGDDPLLGRGRNAQDPYRGLVTDEGNIDIPLDVQGTGWWLTGLFGAPVTGAAVKATGSISFSAQPAANSTITLNGVTWTFVSGSPTGNQTQIGVSLDATLNALATDLNGSADVEIAKCTYTADTANDQLDIEFDTAGATGNAWTLAASAAANGTPSAATLIGGGVPHVWESGSDTIPSHTIEIGQPYTDAQIDAALVRAGVMAPERSLQETRTVKGGQLAAAATIGAGAIGAIRETVGQAHDALAGVVPYLDAAKWGLLAVTLIGIGVMLWTRIDDRRKGLR